MGGFFSNIRENCFICINSNKSKKITFYDIIDDIDKLSKTEYNNLIKHLNNNYNCC